MAKKKKNKGASSDAASNQAGASTKADAPASAAAAVSTHATGNKQLDAAYASGNYAAIRHFALGTPEAQKLLELTKVDMGQAVVGFIAMIVVLSVAFATLH